MKNKFWLIANGLLIILIIIILTVNFQDSNLIITRSALSVDAAGQQIISGTVENKTGDKTYSKVQVDISYLNASDQIISKDALETNSLGPHMVWGFKSKVSADNAIDFKIKASSLHVFGLRW